MSEQLLLQNVVHPGRPNRKEQYTAIRKLAIELILGTDMATHFDNHKLCKRTVDESGPDPQRWEHPAIALQWMVHTADICSTARPFATADLWTDRLLDEFFLQGDRERELGLPVSPLCDRLASDGGLLSGVLCRRPQPLQRPGWI